MGAVETLGEQVEGRMGGHEKPLTSSTPVRDLMEDSDESKSSPNTDCSKDNQGQSEELEALAGCGGGGA